MLGAIIEKYDSDLRIIGVLDAYSWSKGITKARPIEVEDPSLIASSVPEPILAHCASSLRTNS